jgi:hypothetical protein
MADTGIQTGPSIQLKAGATNACGDVVSFMNSVDVTFSGKNVDVTSFAASAPTYVAQKQAIKDLKATAKGFLARDDAGQADIWTAYTTPGDLYLKIYFGATPTYYVVAKVVVDSILVAATPEGLLTVTYSFSGNGTVTIT